MSKNHQKSSGGPLLAVLALLTAGSLLTGCSSGSKGASADPGSSSTAPSSSRNATGVAYAQCMRSHGISNYPDPKTDSQGRVQLTVPPGIDPNSPTFQSAQSACQSKLLQGDTGAGANTRAFDATKVAAWAKCIRTHGMPNFQDPQVDGNTIIVDAQADGMNGLNDPNFTKATAACYSIRPGGNLMVKGGGPQ